MNLRSNRVVLAVPKTREVNLSDWRALTVNIKFIGLNLYSLSCVLQLRNLNSNTGAHNRFSLSTIMLVRCVGQLKKAPATSAYHVTSRPYRPTRRTRQGGL